MYKIKKIKILPLAYTLSLIYFILGIALGVFLLIAKSSSTFSSLYPNLINLSLSQIILLYPVAYAIGGFILGIVISYIYNQVSRFTGGIVIELEKEKTLEKTKEESRIVKKY